MRKATGKGFAVCLLKAWEIYRLTKSMKTGVVSFIYEKADGTIRRAQGTLKEIQDLIKGTGTENFKTVRYFDVDADGFRSFKVENFISVY